MMLFDSVPTISLITAPPSDLLGKQQHLIQKNNAYIPTDPPQMHTNTIVSVTTGNGSPGTFSYDLKTLMLSSWYLFNTLTKYNGSVYG